MRDAVGVADGCAAVVGEHGVAAFDVFEIAQDGARRQAGAARAEVPLQVADPQHQLGDGGGARVEFEAEELVRVDGEAFGFEALLGTTQGLADAVREVEDFAFEALHVFERDVEEIGRAAGGVEHAHLTQAVVEGVDFGERGGGLAFVGEQQRGGLDVGPLFAQRRDDGG